MPYGACLADALGAPYEWKNPFHMGFDEFVDSLGEDTGINGTDDTLMTIAVMKTFNEFAVSSTDLHADIEPYDFEWQDAFKSCLVDNMVTIGRKHINMGFGGKFLEWIKSENHIPYGSWGNGSAMRVSPVGWVARDIGETMQLAKLTADVSHDCIEGERGAQAVALAVFLARLGFEKDEMEFVLDKRINKPYKNNTDGLKYYELDRTVDEILDAGYKFEVSCPKSVPEAICAYLDPSSKDYVSTVFNAIRLNGDTDTQAAMAGGIASARWYMPDDVLEIARERIYRLDPEYVDVIDEFDKHYAVIEKNPES